MSSVHFDPSFWQHVHHPRVVEFSMLFPWVSGSQSVSCLGTSKKLSLGCDECPKTLITSLGFSEIWDQFHIYTTLFRLLF